MTGRAKQYIEALQGRYPTPAQAKELYRLRDLDVAELQAKPMITLADVQTLERQRRFRIANETLDKCDAEAQDALRNDPYHGVRAAVVTFARAFPSDNHTAAAA
jgi:hypothetical protein